VSVDYQGTKQVVLGALGEIVELAEQAGAVSLARRLREDRIGRLSGEKFHLVVLGEFNHGKTTFVNALLGSAVLPAGVTPTTAIIHEISWGEKPTSVAVTATGERRDMPIDELASYVVGGKAAKDDVVKIEVRHPSPLLASGLVLVDTPGVNDLNLTRAEITYSYVPRSDAVVFLLDAGQILKESERTFLAQKLLASSRDKVLFVVNKVDLLSGTDREQALAYARTNLAKLTPEPRVYGLSAQRALAGDALASGLTPFLDDLQRFLTEERGKILLDNALGDGVHAARMLRQGVEIQQSAVGLEQGELDRRVGRLESEVEGSAAALADRQARMRESVAAVKAVVRRDVEAFGERFALALPAEIEASKTEDLRRYLHGFIEERFRSFADSEAAEVAKRLEHVADEAIAFLVDDAQAKATRIRETLGPSVRPLELKVDTFAYDVGVFALGAFGITIMALSNVLVGGALTLAAPVLAVVFRGRADKELKKRAADEAPDAVRKAAEKMADAFDAEIDRFADKLTKFVAQASEEMTRSVAELLRVARTAKGEGDEARLALESRATVAIERLGGLEKRLEELRAGLWGGTDLSF